MNEINKFSAWDYVVFAAVLVSSAGIGAYVAFFSKKQETSEDFLMGGRKMKVFPVALSLLCSFVSAITILGNPVEVYLYGTQYLLLAFAFIPMTLSLAYLYVPVYFNLQFASAYEYFERRFNSTVRMTMSIISILYMVVLMSVTVAGPSLALNQVAGINDKLATACIFIVCIFYSSLGGLKSVLYTDTLQALIMLISLAVVVGKGITDIGGWSVMWKRVENADRVSFFNFDPDPRTRHSFWTSTIGGYLQWIPLFGATQSQIQRYVSVPTLRKARQALFINMIGLMAIVFLCFLAGMAIFARYYDCDPIGSNQVKANDQLLPYFVMDVLGPYPGLPGLFVAGITAASMSSVSSGLNALALVVTQDYVKKFRPATSEIQLGRLSKILTVVFGIISFGCSFLAELLGDVFPAALLLVGTFLGPTFGLYSLGMLFPWANAWGSYFGMLAGIVFMLFISIGSLVADDADLPNQKLPHSTIGCHPNDTIFVNTMNSFNYERVNTDWKDREYSGLIKLFSISSTWYPGIGTVSTVFFGLLFSILLIPFVKRVKVQKKLLSPPILSMWKKILPKEHLNKWVDFDEFSETKDNEIKNQKIIYDQNQNYDQESGIRQRKLDIVD